MFLIAKFDTERVWFFVGVLALAAILQIAVFIIFFMIFAGHGSVIRKKLRRYLLSLDQWRIEPEGKSLKDFPFFTAVLSEAIQDCKPSPMGICRGEIPRWMFHYYYLGQFLAPSFSNCAIIISCNDNFGNSSLRLRHKGKFTNRLQPRHLYNYLRVDFILNDNDLQGWHALNQDDLDKELLSEMMRVLQATKSVREVILTGSYICCISHPEAFRHHELEELRNTSQKIEELVANHKMKQQT